MRRLLFFLAFALLALPAFAGDYPDIKGQWTSKTTSVVHGKLGHRAAASTPEFKDMEFTLRIDKQEDGRFIGERAAAKHKEMVLGLIDENGVISMVDDDGVFMGTYDKATDTIKLTYMEPGKDSKVVSRATYARVKK
jgi:hypothetical protein